MRIYPKKVLVARGIFERFDKGCRYGTSRGSRSAELSPEVQQAPFDLKWAWVGFTQDLVNLNCRKSQKIRRCILKPEKALSLVQRWTCENERYIEPSLSMSGEVLEDNVVKHLIFGV